VRDRIGAAEDRLFSTVFLGTGLLFVAMLFVAAATAGALLEVEGGKAAAGISNDVWGLGRHTTYLVLTVYAMRMAGAFTIVTTSIVTRLHIVPRWLAVFGWIMAAGLLLIVESLSWGVLLFPLWVLVFSVHLLRHAPDDADESGPRGGAT
jgi:hypothetical protein